MTAALPFANLNCSKTVLGTWPSPFLVPATCIEIQEPSKLLESFSFPFVSDYILRCRSDSTMLFD